MGVSTLNMMIYAHLSVNPFQTLIKDNGNNTNFIEGESGRGVLNQVNKINSYNETEWFHLPDAQTRTHRCCDTK